MTYWVKFKDKNPTIWRADNDFDLLRSVISMISREPEIKLEWIIKE